jgi:hypothetical protein
VKDLVTEDELRIHRDGQARFHIAQSVSLDPIGFAVARDRERKAGDLPFVHRFADEVVEVFGESVCHAIGSSSLRDPAFG